MCSSDLNELLLQQVADGIQRGIQLFSLSPRIQAEYLTAMQIVMDHFNGNLRVRAWTILNRATPILFSDPVPDADQPLFWLLTQYLPPRPHVLPRILRPSRTYPERPLLQQLPALPRVMTANTAATPGARLLRRSFLPILTGIVPQDRDRPTWFG